VVVEGAADQLTVAELEAVEEDSDSVSDSDSLDEDDSQLETSES